MANKRQNKTKRRTSRKGGSGILTDIAAPVLLLAANTYIGKKKTLRSKSSKNKKRSSRRYRK